MKRFTFIVFAIFMLALALPVEGDTRGSGFVITGDAFNTRRPSVPAGFALPVVTSVDPGVSVGYIALIAPTDGTNVCEGRIVIKTFAGLRCIDGVTP